VDAQATSAAAAAAFDIVGRLVTPQNLGMSAALWLALEMARRLAPRLFQSGVFKRLLPILPEAIGAGVYWLVPALAAPGASLGERLLTGIAVGTGSSKVMKIIRQTLLGKDSDIVAAKVAKDKKAAEEGGAAQGEKPKDEKKP
jgi:hypothetical protein